MLLAVNISSGTAHSAHMTMNIREAFGDLRVSVAAVDHNPFPPGFERLLNAVDSAHRQSRAVSFVAFGDFVVGGNYVVGFVIFPYPGDRPVYSDHQGCRERVAEVAARFTLDAMPGKQMSIDADLNSGLITESEARHRRQLIAREADFYGAMDGAAKFVKGDAIAGIIILVIDLLGGLAVGMFQRGMDFSGALSRFALLTVGDGLVTQIPALLISTATGIVVTRGASENNLGTDVTRQLFAQYRTLGTAAVVVALFGLVGGLPQAALLGLGCFLWSPGYGHEKG
jgi:flagellar biosynthesis protein FlhA